jgi:hypothetical protein
VLDLGHGDVDRVEDKNCQKVNSAHFI